MKKSTEDKFKKIKDFCDSNGLDINAIIDHFLKDDNLVTSLSETGFLFPYSLEVDNSISNKEYFERIMNIPGLDKISVNNSLIPEDYENTENTKDFFLLYVPNFSTGVVFDHFITEIREGGLKIANFKAFCSFVESTNDSGIFMNNRVAIFWGRRSGISVDGYYNYVMKNSRSSAPYITLNCMNSISGDVYILLQKE